MMAPPELISRLEKLLTSFRVTGGKMAVLSGAGISAESGVPTFRGPEGYWRVGSREYRPEQMATNAMFEKDPWEVWSWYLYRRTVCARAEPNPGHKGVAEIEKILGERFRLITQNVDGLHLRAGNSPERTYQIHGNLHFMRCARDCTAEILPIPDCVSFRDRGEPVPEEEKSALRCPLCGAMTRPHVLWFDEFYNEGLFRAESAFRWAQDADLLLVVGTSGATTLPMQIGEMFSRKPNAVILDINPDPNPFRRLAETHPNGLPLTGGSAEMIPLFLETWKHLFGEGSC